MSLAQLRRSLRLWERRLAYRRNRLRAARRRRDQARVDHWTALSVQADRMVRRRRLQIKEHAPIRVRAFRHAETLVGIMEHGGNNVGPRVSQLIRDAGGTPGEPWCFAAGTLVQTPDGLRRIEALKIGDAVTTASGGTGIVAATGSRRAATVKLRAFGVADTVCSDDHPYLVRRNTGKPGMPILVEPEWLPIGQTSPGDYICLPALDGGTVPHAPSSAYVLGRFMADGWTVVKTQRKTQRHRSAYLCCAHGEADTVREALADADMLMAEREYPTVTQFSVPVRSIPFDEVGGHARTKRVPGRVMSWDREARTAFLSGYLDGDGHQEKPGVTTANTVSRELAYGIAHVARSLGKTAAVYAYERSSTDAEIQGRKVNIAPVRYELRISDDAGHVREGQWAPIRKVEPVGDAEVYNLTVLGESTFIADGAAVHNCGDFVIVCYRNAGSRLVDRSWAAVRLMATAGVRATTDPQQGDIVRFRFDHTGLFDCWCNASGERVVKSKATHLRTIEGNTGASGAVSDSVTGGDGVYRKVRDKSLVADFLRVPR